MPLALPLLRTQRLILRGPQAGDAERLAPLANDFGVVRMTGRMPFPYLESHARDFLDRIPSEVGREATWVLADAEGPFGALGLFPEDPPGRGYASEAAQAALAWADQEWRVRCVVARCFHDNPGSMRVLEKAGFLPTGVVHACPSLARGAPAPSRLFIRLP
jgi:RimJ/RimL family protein N-acetyltransferase